MEPIYYSSTRSHDEKQPFSQAVLAGIAKDGGLFVPSRFPKVDLASPEWLSMDYQATAQKILSLFLDDFTPEELSACVTKAYDHKFSSPQITPITTLGAHSFLELFHGPTSAFKDMALSILPHFLKTSIRKLGVEDEIVILTATSGDTGKAALEGFADVQGVKIIVFYPTDGVSDIQKLQMTTQSGDNVAVFGIEGNFDDAQRGVKQIFLDKALGSELKEMGYAFSSANSINIGRLIPQVVYYVAAYFNLVKSNKISMGDPINIAVPTGNFGNILAAYYAKLMGMPFAKFICASNVNNVLTDFIKTGVYDTHRDFFASNTPSMDILVSSNLERFLYLLSGEDTAIVRSLMNTLQLEGRYEITPVMKHRMQDFYGGYATESETLTTISKAYDDAHYVLDPHTAVAYKVALDYTEKTGDTTHTLIAATASPFKFSDSVAKALSIPETGDAFEQMALLAQTTDTVVPTALNALKHMPVKHGETIKCDHMLDAVRSTLKK